jgi:hypothetical protein
MSARFATRSYRLVHWAATSLVGRYLHRAIHPRAQAEACVMCRWVWWWLTDIEKNRPASPSEGEGS